MLAGFGSDDRRHREVRIILSEHNVLSFFDHERVVTFNAMRNGHKAKFSGTAALENNVVNTGNAADCISYLQVTVEGQGAASPHAARQWHPQPDTTISVCPSGCVCQAVRAPGSKVTSPPRPAPAPAG
ncbi:hypothetical protein CHELA40_12330 [Chelatococcus asaccharovorans]|nr:hypothetical protein CHELA40_12330 [Chelatococcus asaccharovorans]CAH1682989.1 hypothetical protein CHELA17_63278 [Chelatococcus asaccharovorans]